MAEDEILDEPSALDLEISGSVGTFAVEPKDGGTSIPVQYIQTHVRFALDDTQQQRLFENLIPVREIFEAKDLGFDDLMQRDIDDGRVSGSLIPYLLQIGAGEQVKFFPPIVTAVIPIGAEKQLQKYYPTVERIDDEDLTRKVRRHRTRSGTHGEEVFEFEQIERNGKLRDFDNARLRLNTAKCKIVIVDGQHRAMALLALYRNVRGWPDRTAAFKDYYKRWSKDVLKDNLRGISLPVVLCVFPTLDGKGTHKETVVGACRSVFLALNKNARPVSTARNILLDDFDIVAHLERRLLSRVKDFDINSPTALRLWNFELDADENKVQLSTTVALSGVMHVFFLLERMLLSPDTPDGIALPRRNYGVLKNLDATLRRLDGHNLLGDEVAQKINRYSFTRDALRVLADSFDTRYARLVVEGFKTFWPYDAMAKASLDLEVKARNRADMQCHAMLFEGQGIQRVFESYVEYLENEISEKYPAANPPPELKAILDDFHGTEGRLKAYQVDFAKLRAQRFLAELGISEAKTTDVLVRAIGDLYKTVFTTSAFQSAVFITFFSIVERYNKTFRGELVYGDDKDEALFSEYINSLNTWFCPENDEDVKRMLNVFLGKATGTASTGTLKMAESLFTLRKIVIPGELKPDEWPKFRYFLLEMWQTKDEVLASLIAEFRERCRHDVIRNFSQRMLRDYCEEKGIDLTDIKAEAKDKVMRRALDSYQTALEALRGQLSAAERDRISGYLVPAATAAEAEQSQPE